MPAQTLEEMLVPDLAGPTALPATVRWCSPDGFRQALATGPSTGHGNAGSVLEFVKHDRGG
jgi:hypothetical protein